VNEPNPREQRIGSLTGVRVCVRCGYNLVHQPIIREPHYDLVIVRCPECATVADATVAALFGRWGARLGLGLAGVWIVFVAAIVFSAGFGYTGLGIAATEIAADPLRSDIDFEWELHESAQVAAGQQRPPSNTFAQWWSGLDQEAFLARRGGFWSAAGPHSLWIAAVTAIYGWLVTSFFIIVMGPFSRRWRVLMHAMVFVCAIGISALVTWNLIEQTPWWHWQASAQLAAPIVMPITLTAGFAGAVCAFLTTHFVNRWCGRSP